MVTIKILGSGCANCKRVEQITKKVVAQMNVDAEIIKVTEYPKIMEYDILSTPGVVVNEVLVSSGRIPTADEITNWINQAQA